MTAIIGNNIFSLMTFFMVSSNGSGDRFNRSSRRVRQSDLFLLMIGLLSTSKRVLEEISEKDIDELEMKLSLTNICL